MVPLGQFWPLYGQQNDNPLYISINVLRAGMLG